jgi:hypothetical protein
MLLKSVKKSLGTATLLAVFGLCVFGYPTEITRMLGIQGLLREGERLNGPEDITMLIRAVLGIVVGAAACVGVWKILRSLFPTPS